MLEIFSFLRCNLKLRKEIPTNWSLTCLSDKMKFCDFFIKHFCCVWPEGRALSNDCYQYIYISVDSSSVRDKCCFVLLTQQSPDRWACSPAGNSICTHFCLTHAMLADKLIYVSYVCLYSSPTTSILRTHSVTSSQFASSLNFFPIFNFTTTYVTQWSILSFSLFKCTFLTFTCKQLHVDLSFFLSTRNLC